jgi:hypothetical protein
MKIKVIKSSGNSYWYVDKIGMIFQTRGIDRRMEKTFWGESYYISKENTKIGVGGWIDKEDCERVK